MRRRQATLLAALATGGTGQGSRSSLLPYRVSASYNEMYDASTPNGVTTEPTI